MLNRTFVVYVFIAILSAVINITFQIISLWIYNDVYSIELSILVGTIFGMPPRYILEKKYVFVFESLNALHDSKLFFLYAFFAIFTTIVFWTIEYLFHLWFSSDYMRYIGGLIGLTIGFYLKFRIDKKYVFK